MFEVITKTPITRGLIWPPIVIGCILIAVCISYLVCATVKRKDCSNVLFYCTFAGIPILFLSMAICTWFFPVETGRYEYTAKLNENLTVVEFAEFQETYTDIEYIGDNVWRFKDKE